MSVRSILEDPAYPQLKAYILEQTGLSYFADKDEDLAARLSRRFALRNATSCAAYLNLLVSQAEMEGLVGELTIGETYFFRQHEHFELLRDTVIPDLLERNRFTRKLRIWSAGCATGAEPYTIAIVLRRDFPAALQGWDVSVLGTDLNVEFLAQARQARFPEWALRETPPDLRALCFLKEGRHWILRPEYRSGVTFQYHNLANSLRPPGEGVFDLIMCRNVMIYFSREQMNTVVSGFYDALSRGGWLLVGHAEPNTESFEQFEILSNPNVTAYRKPLADSASARQPSFPPAAYPPAWDPWAEDFSLASAARAPIIQPVIKLAPIEMPPAPAQPPPPTPTAELARALADSGAWEEAAAVSRQVTETDPLNAAAHFTLGLILEHTDSCAEAERSLRRAIYLDREFVMAHYHLGTCLQRQGRGRQARKAFENVLQLLQSHPDEEALYLGDGITGQELKELARMHLDLLGKA